MKHGKKPTVRQATLITEEGLNYREWLVVKDMPHSMIIVHWSGGEWVVIEK